MTARIVVMGPSGSGKALVGAALAARLRCRFVDGDDLLPAAAVAKMRAGRPLDDADRSSWLAALVQSLGGPSGVVVAFSALRRTSRDGIRSAVPDAWFVELVAAAVAPTRRMSRRDRVLPTPLLDPQDAGLEPLAADEAGVRVADDAGLDDVVARIVELRAQSLR